MERQVAGWVVGAWIRRPWFGAAVLVLAMLPWVVATSSEVGIASQHFDRQALTINFACLAALVGGALGLELLAGVQGASATLARSRMWRLRVGTLLLSTTMPALVVWVSSVPTTSAESMLRAGPELLWILISAALIDVARVPEPRSISFVAVAWVLPAWGAFLEPPAAHTGLADSLTTGSTPSPATIAPMLALTLAALGADLLRRRSP